jgi:uncharacterized OB-fold protein
MTDDAPPFEAAVYANGSVTYPPHPVGPDGAERTDTLDLREYEAHVVTWTTSTATPPGVRQPNTLVIVEFDLSASYDGPPVRALGQVVVDGGGTDVDTPDDEAADGEEQPGTDAQVVAIGDRVEPVYVTELRDPEAGIREPASQSWDGFRFRPVE